MVSISDAARQAAKADPGGTSTATATAAGGYVLPEAVRQIFDKDFSPEVLSEARRRLEAIREKGSLGAEGPLNLPLLPENKALLASFRDEMKSLSAQGVDKMDANQSARFNQLLNLSARLQMLGWKTPMTEADVAREFDIGNAMAKLAAADPSLQPAPPSTDPAQNGPGAGVTLPADDAVPEVWQRRWQASGITLPSKLPGQGPGDSLWLSLAKAAGVDENTFLTHLRTLASQLDGHALTEATERYLSERYAETTKAATV